MLFLFVIMLLDLKAEARRRIKIYGFVAGLVSVGAILAIFFKNLRVTTLATTSPLTQEGTTEALGRLLFTSYVLPFEVDSVLLLVAIIG